MTAYNDPPAESEPPLNDQPKEQDSAIKVYERPKRTVPAWMLALYAIIGLALLWFLFTYVF